MSPDQSIPPLEALPRKIRASDLVALSDAALGRYLEEHRLDGGVAIRIDVEDPENLPGSFIEKLRDKARDLTDAARAGAVNLDEVNSRLLNIVRSDTPVSGHDPAQSGSPKPSTRSPTPENDMVERYERECYEDLVRDGGRPMYPIELVNQLAEDPAAYPDLVRPWPLLPRMRSMIFEAQWHHWKFFRSWQEHTRQQSPLSEITSGPITQHWEANKVYSVFVTQFLSKNLMYSDAAANLLKEHYFSRRGIQFLQDRTQQDKVTEWIEYLAFECAKHNWYGYQIQRCQKRIDACWETLASSGLLRPYETREYVCDKSSTPVYQAEVDRIQRELDLAEFEFEEAQTGANTDQETMATATQKLDEAKREMEVFQQRKELTIPYNTQVHNRRKLEEEQEKQGRLLEWVRDQVPLVEAEVRTTLASEGGLPGTDVPPKGTATRKRARDLTDSAKGSPPTKRSRRATLSGQPRRSARIAERREKAAVDQVVREKTAPKKATKQTVRGKVKPARETRTPAKPAKVSSAGTRALAARKTQQRKQPAPRKRR
ncbi:hypothetical protein B0J18DRAFT_430913 [Chaetomium sp. MPI-SDFR-AT-0129]|nr:hypothetical protein B0J18DRAFT_430913 [Chaetomium sp. MPI-SDFR-AT-0129]